MRIIDAIVQDIKNKKELENLDDSFVLDKVKLYLDNNTIKQFEQKEISSIKKSGKYKKITKEVRALLRRVYGVFQAKEFRKRKSILEKIKNTGTGSTEML